MLMKESSLDKASFNSTMTIWQVKPDCTDPPVKRFLSGLNLFKTDLPFYHFWSLLLYLICIFLLNSYCDNNEIQRTGVCTGTTPPYTTPATVSPKFATGTPTIPPSTLPPVCVQTGPTSWMSVGTPSPYNQGDIESFPALRQQYTFCDNSQMTAIECRVVGTQTSSAASKQRVFCDLRNGLKCYHSDQQNGEQCLNYEVRITCDCGK